MLLNAVWIAALFVAAYVIPGLLARRLALPALDGPGGFAVSVALGLVVVNVPAVLVTGLVGLSAPLFLTRGVVLLTALVVSLALAALLWRRERWSWLRPIRPGRTSVALGAFTVAATVFFLGYYDWEAMQEQTCIVEAAVGIHDDLFQLAWEDGESGDVSPETIRRQRADYLHAAPATNDFLRHNEGQRLGPQILVAPFLALFGLPGLRFAYALQGLLLPGVGFVLGRRLFGRPAAAWAAAVFLTFTPYTFEGRMFDENFMSAMYGALTLALLVGDRVAPAVAGATFSLFLGIRHIAVVALPGVLLHLRRLGRGAGPSAAPPWPVLRFLAALVLFAAPYVVLHAFRFVEQGLVFEGQFERPAMPHAMLGVDFDLRVLLGFPFHELARSPYTAAPLPLLFPLDIARRFGLLALALVPGGVVWLVRHRPGVGRLFAWWFVPVLALLMIQSNWIEPEKMGVPASVIAPVVLLVIAGVLFLRDAALRLRTRLVVTGASLALFSLAAWAMHAVEAPQDSRVLAAFEQGLEEPAGAGSDGGDGPPERWYNPENAAFLAWERRRHAPTLLPAPNVSEVRPDVLARGLGYFAAELRRPAIDDYEQTLIGELIRIAGGHDWYAGPLEYLRDRRRIAHGRPPWDGPPPPSIAPDEPRVTAALTLAEPPALAEEPLRVLGEADEGGADADAAAPALPLPPPGAVHVVPELRVPWAETPLVLVVFRDRQGTVLLALLPAMAPRPPEVLAAEGIATYPAPPADAAALRLVLPRGELVRLIDARGAVPRRMYSRYLRVGDDGAVCASFARPI